MTTYEKYTLPVGKEDQLRLATLNELCNPHTLNFIQKNLPNLSGKTIIDVGCGTGIMSCELAKLVGEKGKVYAVDISEEQLNLTKELAASQNIHNIETICTSIDKLETLTSSADLVYSRFVIEHLQDPYAALQKMIGTLKTGGFLFCETITSYDAMFSDPEMPEFNQWKKLVLLQPKLFNTNFYIGKELYSYFKKLGLAPTAFELQQPLLFDSKLKNYFLSAIYNPSFQKLYVDKGFYTAEEVAAIAQAIKAFSQTDALMSFPQYIQISARK